MGGGGLITILFFVLPNFLALILAVPVGIFAAALAFYKVNNRPFVLFVESAFRHALKNKLYVWKKEESKGSFSETSLSGEGESGSLKDKTFMLSVEEKGEIEEQKRAAEKADVESSTNDRTKEER